MAVLSDVDILNGKNIFLLGIYGKL